MLRWLITSFIFLIISQLTLGQNVIRPDGKPQKIFEENQVFMRPVWSPAGDKIAFTSSNQRGIWVLELATQKITQITDKEGAGYKFAWSPDGEYIAFRARYSDNYRSVMDIEVVDVNSEKIFFLTPQQKHLGLPQWGNSNASLFVTQEERLMEIKTGIPLTKSLAKAKPDIRTKMIFTRYGKLHFVLIEKPDSIAALFNKIEVINPVISPAEDYVACEEYGGDLLIINLKNNNKINLGSGHRPSWSPDGTWLSYMVAEDDGHQYLASDIYIASVDGQQKLKITDSDDLLEMNPNWSPDGNYLVYDEFISGAIYVQKLTIE